MQNELYNIDNRIRTCFDIETGEIFDIEQLEALEMAKDDVIENLVMMRAEIMAQKAGIKSEIDRLKALADAKQTTIERIEGWLSKSLDGIPYEPQSGMFSIKFSKGKSTEVYDFEALKKWDVAGNYISFGEPKPNKTAIKNAIIKDGLVIPGCSVVETSNINIK